MHFRWRTVNDSTGTGRSDSYRNTFTPAAHSTSAASLANSVLLRRES